MGKYQTQKHKLSSFTEEEIKMLREPLPSDPCYECFDDNHGNKCDDCIKWAEYMNTMNKYRATQIFELAFLAAKARSLKKKLDETLNCLPNFMREEFEQ